MTDVDQAAATLDIPLVGAAFAFGAVLCYALGWLLARTDEWRERRRARRHANRIRIRYHS